MSVHGSSQFTCFCWKHFLNVCSLYSAVLSCTSFEQCYGAGISHCCSSMFIIVCTLYIPVCTWYRQVHHVLCLYMVYLSSPVSAGNISVMYAVCTHLYSAVPALDNAMVQESATWYIKGMLMYEPSKNGSGRWVAFLCYFPILRYRHHLATFC